MSAIRPQSAPAPLPALPAEPPPVLAPPPRAVPLDGGSAPRPVAPRSPANPGAQPPAPGEVRASAPATREQLATRLRTAYEQLGRLPDNPGTRAARDTVFGLIQSLESPRADVALLERQLTVIERPLAHGLVPSGAYDASGTQKKSGPDAALYPYGHNQLPAAARAEATPLGTHAVHPGTHTPGWFENMPSGGRSEITISKKELVAPGGRSSDCAWLGLEVASSGSGPNAGVSYVSRVNTAGGNPPTVDGAAYTCTYIKWSAP